MYSLCTQWNIILILFPLLLHSFRNKHHNDTLLSLYITFPSQTLYHSQHIWSMKLECYNCNCFDSMGGMKARSLTLAAFDISKCESSQWNCLPVLSIADLCSLCPYCHYHYCWTYQCHYWSNHNDPISIPTSNQQWPMMTSSNGNIFCVTGHLCGECFQWKKATDVELWCFLSSAPQ